MGRGAGRGDAGEGAHPGGGARDHPARGRAVSPLDDADRRHPHRPTAGPGNDRGRRGDRPRPPGRPDGRGVRAGPRPGGAGAGRVRRARPRPGIPGRVAPPPRHARAADPGRLADRRPDRRRPGAGVGHAPLPGRHRAGRPVPDPVLRAPAGRRGGEPRVHPPGVRGGGGRRPPPGGAPARRSARRRAGRRAHGAAARAACRAGRARRAGRHAAGAGRRGRRSPTERPRGGRAARGAAPAGRARPRVPGARHRRDRARRARPPGVHDAEPAPGQAAPAGRSGAPGGRDAPAGASRPLASGGVDRDGNDCPPSDAVPVRASALPVPDARADLRSGPPANRSAASPAESRPEGERAHSDPGSGRLVRGRRRRPARGRRWPPRADWRRRARARYGGRGVAPGPGRKAPGRPAGWLAAAGCWILWRSPGPRSGSVRGGAATELDRLGTRCTSR